MAKSKTKTTTKKTTETDTNPIVAAPAVAESASTDRSYTFNTLCKSGETKTVTITAASLSDAREQLREFTDKN